MQKKLLNLFAMLIAVLLALNIFTPLRLNIDGIRYLKIAEYISGNALNSPYIANDFLPHGYPWLLTGLIKLHLLSPMSITVINIISVLLTALLLIRLLDIKNKVFFLLLTVLSFINIKHLTLPLADQLFGLFFMAAIYYWSAYFSKRRMFLLPALILTVLSICLRTAGIAIIPGVVAFLIHANYQSIIKNKSVLFGLVTATLLLLILLFVKFPLLEAHVDYFRQLSLSSLIKKPFSIFYRIYMHLKEAGEIILNIPYSKLTTALTIAGFDSALYSLAVLGLLLFYLAFKSALRLKILNKPIFWITAIYIAMIFIWPFYDERFFLPVVPLLLYLTFSQLVYAAKNVNIRPLYLCSYFVFGLLALLFSDAISLSNSFFLKYYGNDPLLTKDYKLHFNDRKAQKAASYDLNKNDVLYMLEKYDK